MAPSVTRSHRPVAAWSEFESHPGHPYLELTDILYTSGTYLPPGYPVSGMNGAARFADVGADVRHHRAGSKEIAPCEVCRVCRSSRR